MSIDAIRSEFVSRLATVTTSSGALSASKFFEDTVTPPCAVVADDDPFIDYDQTFDQGERYNFRVVVYASRADVEAGQAMLDTLRDSGAIRTALNGGWSSADYAVVHQAGPVQRYDVGGILYLGSEFTVEVIN